MLVFQPAAVIHFDFVRVHIKWVKQREENAVETGAQKQREDRRRRQRRKSKQLSIWMFWGVGV